MALLRNERDGGERDRAFVRARQIQLNSFPIDKNWNGTLVLVPPLVGEVDEGETCSRPFLFDPDRLLPKPNKLARGNHAAMPYKAVGAFVAKLREREAISQPCSRILYRGGRL